MAHTISALEHDSEVPLTNRRLAVRGARHIDHARTPAMSTRSQERAFTPREGPQTMPSIFIFAPECLLGSVSWAAEIDVEGTRTRMVTGKVRHPCAPDAAGVMQAKASGVDFRVAVSPFACMWGAG